MRLQDQHEAVTFLRRTASSYAGHQRRARLEGQALDYTLPDLRDLVQAATACPYCRVALRPDNFSVDHAHPTARGGSYRYANLAVCCARCNQTKGALSASEFAQLLALAGSWPFPARTHLLARLRAGGRAFGKK